MIRWDTDPESLSFPLAIVFGYSATMFEKYMEGIQGRLPFANKAGRSDTAPA